MKLSSMKNQDPCHEQLTKQVAQLQVQDVLQAQRHMGEDLAKTFLYAIRPDNSPGNRIRPCS
jgi:hypothetical protein